MNVKNYPYEHATEIVKPINSNHLDVLIEAATIMDDHLFCKKLLQNASDYMAMYDCYKKDQKSIQQVPSTNKKPLYEALQKISILTITVYKSKIGEANILVKIIEFIFEMQGMGEYLTNA